ncbi:hypothetical protein U27_04028 [Candidatus Vecturithrix granuli]|uniref:Uncharacterized protein n=1 Tax=Vecturithrix granuli TaxID=1499967 RepID=A0A081BXK9_VECG1|nr:hypothetical protein U27_04028 [Candidatus Vecturithrix granuli]
MKILLKSVLLIVVVAFTSVSGVFAACTEDNWTYSDGQCASNFTTTRTWTKIGACTGGVTHPATETVSCIYRGANYTCQSLSTYNVSIGTQVIVSTVQEFWNAINQAESQGGNMTILIEDGTYEIASPSHYPYIEVNNVIFRSRSGNRASVVLTGGGMRATGDTENVFGVVGNNITIADLTIGECGNHGISVNGDNLFVHNVRIYNTYEQMLKGTDAGDGADNGIVQCSLFEYPDGIGPQFYIGGIDVHEGNDWIVRDNTFRYIKSPDPSPDFLAEHAIHFWNASADTRVERNRITNCDRGIGFGLGSSSHSGGLIVNNMVHTTRDVGIGLETSPNTQVYNNSVYTQNYSNSIEYRFAATTGVKIYNNLTNAAISDRSSGSSADLRNNRTTAQASWFVGATSGDLHLAALRTDVVDQGLTISAVTVDYDRQTRPQGAAYDIGADEFMPTFSYLLWTK